MLKHKRIWALVALTLFAAAPLIYFVYYTYHAKQHDKVLQFAQYKPSMAHVTGRPSDWLPDLLVELPIHATEFSNHECIGVHGSNRTCQFSKLLWAHHFYYFFVSTNATLEADMKLVEQQVRTLHVSGLKYRSFGSEFDNWLTIVPLIAVNETRPAFQVYSDKHMHLYMSINVTMKYEHAPSFYMTVHVFGNIGHTIYDDLIAVYSALVDLNHKQRMNNWNIIIASEIVFEWSNLMNASYHGLIGKKAVFSAELPPFILYQTLATGLLKRAIHTFHRIYTGYEFADRLFWNFRQHYLQNLQVPDNDWTVNGYPQRLRLLMVNKREKRSVANFDELVAATAAKFPDIEVIPLYFEDLKSHEKELQLLTNVQIGFGVDGTGSLMFGLMPAGSVFISGGRGVNNRYSSMADALYGMYDHLKVLYYDKYKEDDFAGEYPVAGGTLENRYLNISIDAIASYVENAIHLIRHNKIKPPLSKDANLSLHGAYCKNLFLKYPDLFEAWSNNNPYNFYNCIRLARNATYWWQLLLPNVPVPADLPKFEAPAIYFEGQ